jgi:hypothetical protein
MRRTLKRLFWAVEINLVLWIVALGSVYSADEHGPAAKSVVAIGVVFAILAQHWAYYSVYKRAKGID